MSHLYARRQHTKERMLKWYGTDYTAGIRKYIVNQIVSGAAEEVKGKGNEGNTVWRVVLESGQKITAVFDPEMLEIVTVLPVRSWDRRKRKPSRRGKPKRYKNLTMFPKRKED